MPREAGENHGDVIAGVLAAGAGDDDAVAVDGAVTSRGLKGQSHFCPGRERGGTAEFDSAFVNKD